MLLGLSTILKNLIADDPYDPYLETREKEDAFLKCVTETIEKGLQFASVGMPQLVQHIAPTTETNSDNEELFAALDFADSF